MFGFAEPVSWILLFAYCSTYSKWTDEAKWSLHASQIMKTLFAFQNVHMWLYRNMFIFICVVEFSLSNPLFHCKTPHGFNISGKEHSSPHLPGFIGNSIIYPGRKIWYLQRASHQCVCYVKYFMAFSPSATHKGKDCKLSQWWLDNMIWCISNFFFYS